MEILDIINDKHSKPREALLKSASSPMFVSSDNSAWSYFVKEFARDYLDQQLDNTLCSRKIYGKKSGEMKQWQLCKQVNFSLNFGPKPNLSIEQREHNPKLKKAHFGKEDQPLRKSPLELDTRKQANRLCQ